MNRIAVVLAAAACSSSSPSPASPSSAVGQLSLAKDVQMLSVPGGKYIAGSTPEERSAAYDDFQNTAGHDAARTHKWFEGEEQRHLAAVDGYRIDLMPVTQAEYAEFVSTKQAPPPSIDEASWKAQGFTQDYATMVARFNWVDDAPPVGREDHPVVLVTWKDASAYCEWRGSLRGEPRRLPTEAEFEKAARGDDGMAYPWGNLYEAAQLNSAVKGPRDTTPVGQFVDGASPFGMLDAAGNVFQWTSSPFTSGKMTVKGSAWDDFAGLGRGAGRHGRPVTARHVIVGFRCAAPPT
jgi:toxoflavin biosynthesis protein ToxD